MCEKCYKKTHFIIRHKKILFLNLQYHLDSFFYFEFVYQELQIFFLFFNINDEFIIFNVLLKIISLIK